MPGMGVYCRSISERAMAKPLKRFTPRVMENRLITFQRSRMGSCHSSSPHWRTMQGPKQWKCLQFMVSITQPSESTQMR